MSSSDKYPIMLFFHHPGSHVNIKLGFLKNAGIPVRRHHGFPQPGAAPQSMPMPWMSLLGCWDLQPAKQRGAASKKGYRLVSSNPPGKKKQNNKPNALITMLSHAKADRTLF